ncbi:dihydrolipoyl dehydrogenase [Bradyrhizobium manausense]|uniref:dihydrolipoyl dehydrogenase n=1 Tax=Bradyrhizobium manausense TaxID=989370 RepID=UPI001BADCEBB|nr:dihydrolipoyl dehydrogenase [Bradyrhizobium manausense]MBR0828621.1 dihydrolipoyl dehydrogenase [Bradyrhizobium manausense]
MTEILTPKVLVVGGGPGGYVAAIRCGQLGLDTVLVEGDRLGGTCLIRGCIPSKALIHAASLYAEMTEAANRPRFGIGLTTPPMLDFGATMAWKDGIVDRLNGGVGGLLRKAKVKTISGWARFSDAKTCSVETADGKVTVRPEHVILATGSKPVELPFLAFGGKVISSTEALSLLEVPKNLVIVGAGYIGLELGIAYRKLGAEVTVVEARSSILPQYDAQLVEPVRRWLKAHRVEVLLNAKALGEEKDGIAIEQTDSGRSILPADRIIVTIGRKAAIDGWGLEAMNLKTSGPFVEVDERCHTSTKNVWAIGDLVGEPMLAHKASAQGEMVAEIIAGKKRRWQPVAIPAVCFTEPEIVSVGIGPADAGPDTISAQFPFAANGRALTMAGSENGGFVRVIAHKDSHRILGIQAVGIHAAELVHHFVTLIEMGAVLEDVSGIIHAHPTLGEATHEASLAALGHALHF